jgi:hypothetical protein
MITIIKNNLIDTVKKVSSVIDKNYKLPIAHNILISCQGYDFVTLAAFNQRFAVSKKIKAKRDTGAQVEANIPAAVLKRFLAAAVGDYIRLEVEGQDVKLYDTKRGTRYAKIRGLNPDDFARVDNIPAPPKMSKGQHEIIARWMDKEIKIKGYFLKFDQAQDLELLLARAEGKVYKNEWHIYELSTGGSLTTWAKARNQQDAIYAAYDNISTKTEQQRREQVAAAVAYNGGDEINQDESIVYKMMRFE